MTARKAKTGKHDGEAQGSWGPAAEDKPEEAKTPETFEEKKPEEAKPENTAAEPKQAGESDNILAAIAYFGLISVIVYALYRGKGNRFVLFHSMQGMLLFATVMVIDLCLFITILGIILIPFVFLGYLLSIAFMGYKAYKGERYKLPLIGKIAENHA